jgi:ribonuclease E
VALQLLRGIEEILMKGATHNLVVRTRNDVALYVLNHKRGHLRDLENGFKVTLSVVSDPNVSGVQSYIIDRGEQVHTLEAAKTLIATQAAAHPMHSEDAADEDEAVDAELESEVETEETEGLAEEAGEAGDSEGEQDGGQRRGKRRRRRRGRGGSEAREASQPREDGEAAVAEPGSETQGEEGEAEEDSGEQPSSAHGDDQGGERRPRRRGRRGGRRRRGGNGDREDGLAGSISDELAPPQASEAEIAVADFDGGAPEPAPSFARPEPVAVSQPSLQPEDHAPHAVAQAPEETAQEAEKAARRRSTVREKVSFGTSSAPAEASAPVTQAPEPAVGETAAESNGEAQPRKAGWWSRRFGGGE